VCLAAVIAGAPATARAWRAGVPPLPRVSLVVLLTELLTPHLLTYDLVLLAVPIVALADWATTHSGRRSRSVIVLGIALYAASFSPVLASYMRLQLSTLAIAGGVWIIASRQHGWAWSATPNEP
jgi:hypothetical protein